MCGWLKDKSGLSWQIVPAILAKLLQDREPEKSKRNHDFCRGGSGGDEPSVLKTPDPEIGTKYHRHDYTMYQKYGLRPV